MTDGPRPLQPTEWNQLDALVSTVFRATMSREYPQLFNEQNRPNLRVIAEDGKVVCHVGMTERAAALAGCRIDVACIGSVATYDEYRGRGFASRTFQDACDKAAADGVDLMLISGGRGLYTRVGCREVGQDLRVVMRAADAARLDAAGATALDLAPVGPDRLAELRALYDTEPVRFLRPLEDWQMAFQCRVVMARAAEFWGISLGDRLVAYLAVNSPAALRRNDGDPAAIRVVEHAGDSASIVAALPRLLEHYRAEVLAMHLQPAQVALRARLAGANLETTPVPTSGTARVINFVQLMERCRPLLAERLGAALARDLRFEADELPGSAAGGFTIRRGEECVRLPDLGTLACYLFGTPTDAPVAPEGSARLATALADALPLPTLWYGLNYV